MFDSNVRPEGSPNFCLHAIGGQATLNSTPSVWTQSHMPYGSIRPFKLARSDIHRTLACRQGKRGYLDYPWTVSHFFKLRSHDMLSPQTLDRRIFIYVYLIRTSYFSISGWSLDLGLRDYNFCWFPLLSCGTRFTRACSCCHDSCNALIPFPPFARPSQANEG